MEKEKITIRLSPAEIELLSTSKSIEEKLTISENNHFTFSLTISESLKTLTAEFKHAALLVQVPAQKMNKWINSKQVGMKETIKSELGSEIKLTLEEDLPPRKFRNKE